jgi:hypothetical protein
MNRKLEMFIDVGDDDSYRIREESKIRLLFKVNLMLQYLTVILVGLYLNLLFYESYELKCMKMYCTQNMLYIRINARFT